MNEEIQQLLYHPIAAGMAAAFALVCTLLIPVGAGYIGAEYTALVVTPSAGYLLGVVATVFGVWLFNKVLYGTLVYDWIAEFIAWCAKYDLYTPGGESA